MASPGGWTYRVALNELRRRLRRGATERSAIDRMARPGPVEDHPPDAEVWQAVRALPEKQRTAIVLRYVADLPEADIAEAMHVSRGTVASNLSDARRALARFLGDQEIGTGRAHGGLPMNELERAATAVRDRPTTPPAPLASIERRAEALRRRRRAFEVVAVGLAVLLLGSAALVLGATRSDDDQGVFVGEGPPKVPTVTTATYRLGSPIDDPTAQALELTIGSRFGSIGLGVPDVQISGTEVTVTTTGPPDDINDINFLVARPGGFELYPVLGEAPEADCAAPGGAADGGALGTSGLTGPPRCLSVGPAVPLPPDPSTVSASGVSPDGTYQLDLILTPVASQSLVDSSPTCPEQPCLPVTLAVVTDGAIFHPEAKVTPSVTDAGMEVRLEMRGLSDPATAERWTSVLVHPLPAGVTLTRVVTDESSATTAQSSGMDVTDSTVTTPASPFPSDLLPVTRTVCVSAPVDEAVLADLAQAVGARFAAIGRTVQMGTRTPRTANFDVSCTSGQAILLSSDYDPGDPDWLGDQIALLAPGVMRAVDGTVLHPEDATSTVYQSIPETQALAITLPASEYAHLRTLKLFCPNSVPCWLNFTIDGTAAGTVVADGATSVSGRTMLVSLLSGSDQQARRLAAVLAHPFPESVTLEA